MVPMNPSQGQALKVRAHSLKPVVTVGNNGLTPAVLHETDLALFAHELIKMKIHAETREARQEMVNTISTELTAHCIQTIGHVAVFYRENPEKEKAKHAK